MIYIIGILKETALQSFHPKSQKEIPNAVESFQALKVDSMEPPLGGFGVVILFPYYFFYVPS